MPGRLDMCFPVCSVRLSYKLAHVDPTVSPRSRTRWGTPCCRSCCDVASPAGPPPTTTTSTRSDTSRRPMGPAPAPAPAPKQVASISPDPLGDAVREGHDRQVGVDLERVGKQARVRDPEPRDAVHPPPAVGDGGGGAPSHPAAPPAMRRGDRPHTRAEMAGSDALL